MFYMSKEASWTSANRLEEYGHMGATWFNLGKYLRVHSIDNTILPT